MSWQWTIWLTTSNSRASCSKLNLATETELKKEFGPQFNKRLDQAKKLAVGIL